MSVLSRAVGLIVAGLALALLPASSQAQAPAKPLKFIVPFGPGGSGDTLARLIGQHLAERIGQPVVAENRMGAGGNIGADVVAKSDPDGATLLMGANYLSIAPNLYKRMSYDPMRDLAPVTLVGSIPNVLVVNNAVPAKTVAVPGQSARHERCDRRANPSVLRFRDNRRTAGARRQGPRACDHRRQTLARAA
jgi:tripartite-type tricarboxylate transporter receptor subunit TctC